MRLSNVIFFTGQITGRLNFAQNQPMSTLRTGLFSFFLLITGLASAQDSTLLLSNVVVTATQSAQQQKESGRNIVSINGAAFNALPVQSVDDLLRYLPGIEVQQRGPQGAQADITIRGGTFQQVLVIIDGMKLNDPLTGHFNLYIPIHPADIERVEILKGAAAAVWGSEAVGGVVNIISKTFAGKKYSNEFRGRLVAGEFGLLNTDLYGRLTKSQNSISGGLFSNNSNGQVLRGTKGFFNLHTANLSFTRQLAANWRLSIRTAADFRKFNAQNFYTSFTSDTANEKVNSAWIQAALQKKYLKGQLQIDAVYKKLRDQYWFRPAAVPNDNRAGFYASQVYFTGQIDAQNGFTVGAQNSLKFIKSNDRGEHSLWHGAVYGILRHHPGKKWYINESLRLDWDESYGWVLVPQLNMALNLDKFTVRGSAGKSFRDADFTERFNNYNKSLVTSGRIGNPGLKAEKAWNVEMGLDYNFSSRFRISTGVFYRDHQDLIDWANTAYADMPRKDNLVPSGSYALAKNVEYIHTSGLELDIMYNEKTGPHSQLLAMMGLTWLKSVNDDPVPSLYISSHARFLLNYSIAWTIKRFGISMTGLYKERAEQLSTPLNAKLSPSFFLMNLKAGWQFIPVKARIFLQADNLFNSAYSDLLGAQMPGRWLSGGIEIAL